MTTKRPCNQRTSSMALTDINLYRAQKTRVEKTEEGIGKGV